VRDGLLEVERIGLEPKGSDDLEAFAARLQGMGLGDGAAVVMLRCDQCMLLQIDAPAVPEEEIRSAARYQIRELVDTHIDDLTLDVLHVGDGRDKSANQIYVVAANKAVIKEAMAVAQAAQWDVSVIDIQEMGQRNLQSALAARAGQYEQATAALVVINERHALFTVCAKGELFYSRRLDLPEGFMAMEFSAGLEFFDDAPDAAIAHATVDVFTPVEEYVPSYADNFGTAAAANYGGEAAGQTDIDRAQRVVVEVQRSVDLWERTWTTLPLAGISVFGGARSADLAVWLSQELGMVVMPMDLEVLYPRVAEVNTEDLIACLPLLGILLRDDGATG
jgi:MSHA biogenesis protein MshI